MNRKENLTKQIEGTGLFFWKAILDDERYGCAYKNSTKTLTDMD
jgi:hypothetical protein